MNRNTFKSEVINGEAGHYVLRGGAGTGKTHLAVQIIKELMQRGKDKIAVVAPSHKARQNFQAMLLEQGITPNQVKVQTVQKFLGKRPDYDFTKKDVAKAEKFLYTRPKSVIKYDLVVIDEFGMLDVKDAQAFKRYADKRLFVGDEAQLPNPDTTSKPIKIERLLKSAKAHTVLTINHRIKNEELQEIADIARNNPSAIKPSVSLQNAINAFLDECKTTDDIAFIVPTNEIVEKISKRLNGKVLLSHNQAEFNYFGRDSDDAEDFTIFNGDVVELDRELTRVPDLGIKGWHTPFYLSPKHSINAELFEKLNAETEVYKFKSHPKIPFLRVYRGTLTSLRANYIQKVWNSYRAYAEVLQKRYELDNPNLIWGIELEDKESSTLKQLYTDLMTVKNILALTDARVFTIYKAQGSTIGTVYTTIPKRAAELYVAVTRASEKLVIVGE